MNQAFEKNFWSLFLLLAFLGLGVTALLCYEEYKTAYTRYETQIRYLSKTTQHTTQQYLLQQETLLDLLGEEVKAGYEKRLAFIRRLFDRLRAVNPSVAGFAVIAPDGRVVLASSNNDPSKLPNIRRQAASAETFERTLRSRRMVPGRAYYLAAIGEWILPLRKAIRDDAGRVVAVVSLGLRLDDAALLWNRLVKPHTTLEIFLDKSWYRIYYSGRPPSRQPELYEKPLSPKLRRHIEEQLKEHGVSLEALRQRGRCFVSTLVAPNGEKMIASFRYLKPYGIWIHFHTPLKEVVASVRPRWILTGILSFGVLTLIFFLFRLIDRIQKRTTDRLVRQATHDDLTGLPNRHYLQKGAKRWFRPDAEPFCVAFIDLDNFKNINDSVGHNIGDKILVQVARRLEETVPEGGVVVRHGGDEFIMILPEHEKERLAERAREILEAVSRPVETEGFRFNVGVSVGFGRYPEDGTTLYELLSAADIAMYEAKRRKNSFAFFDEGLRTRRQRDTLIEQELRTALERNEFYVLYQPQLDARGRVRGVEALLRWRNARLGEVSPAEFIPLAEEIGIMPAVGDFVLNQSLEEIAALRSRRGEELSLSINVSIRQFNEPEFTRRAHESVRAHGLEPETVVLEITESLFIEELERIVRQLQALKSRGFRLSLDDFGTGYSSLSLLRRLPIDELKIDRSFIETLLVDRESEAMVRAILNLAQTLEIETVAEGVEEPAQAKWLRDHGCRLFQGYLFAKPLNIKELEAFLQRSTELYAVGL